MDGNVLMKPPNLPVVDRIVTPSSVEAACFFVFLFFFLLFFFFAHSTPSLSSFHLASLSCSCCVGVLRLFFNNPSFTMSDAGAVRVAVRVRPMNDRCETSSVCGFVCICVCVCARLSVYVFVFVSVCICAFACVFLARSPLDPFTHHSLTSLFLNLSVLVCAAL